MDARKLTCDMSIRMFCFAPDRVASGISITSAPLMSSLPTSAIMCGLAFVIDGDLHVSPRASRLEISTLYDGSMTGRGRDMNGRSQYAPTFSFT